MLARQRVENSSIYYQQYIFITEDKSNVSFGQSQTHGYKFLHDGKLLIWDYRLPYVRLRDYANVTLLQ